MNVLKIWNTCIMKTIQSKVSEYCKVGVVSFSAYLYLKK